MESTELIRDIITKNMISATAGFPIAFIINLSLLPTLVKLIEYDWFFGTLALGIPYFAVAVIRMTLIDYVWNRYNINIDPTHYFKKFINNGNL